MDATPYSDWIKSTFLAFLALVVISFLILFSWQFNRQLHGDSVVPVLASTIKWAPFYWEQNRLGSFVPLLAILISNPFLSHVI